MGAIGSREWNDHDLADPARTSAQGPVDRGHVVSRRRPRLAQPIPKQVRLKQELEKTQQELSETQQQLEELNQKVDALEQPTPAPPTATPATARLAPVNVDNPAISFVVDTAFSQDAQSSWQSIGYPNGADFSLQNGELFISAPIDPFVRGYASINGTSDEGFDIEEAALVTTALPWNLTVKGGRFFADVGRLPHWHDEALPFVEPPAVDRPHVRRRDGLGGRRGHRGSRRSSTSSS